MSVKTTSDIIPDALKNFDSLPSSGFVRPTVKVADLRAFMEGK